jgi:hypothetical protein
LPVDRLAQLVPVLVRVSSFSDASFSYNGQSHDDQLALLRALGLAEFRSDSSGWLLSATKLNFMGYGCDLDSLTD